MKPASTASTATYSGRCARSSAAARSASPLWPSPWGRSPTRSRTSWSPSCCARGSSCGRPGGGWPPTAPGPIWASSGRAAGCSSEPFRPPTLIAVANFICPNCGERSLGTERTAGFQNRPKACKRCGFGFLFELLDDYYPAPNAAFFVCDQQGRLIGTGRGVRELTGLGDLDVIGRDAREVLGLEFENGDDHISTALEWGVRMLDK